MRPETLTLRAQHFFDVIGRIKPSVTLEQARADLERVAIEAQKKYPETNDQRGTTMVPLQEAVVGDVRQAVVSAWRRRRPAAAHRVRQRREPDAGPERRQASGAGRQERARRGPVSPRAPAAGRRRRAGSGRRRRRRGHRHVADASDRSSGRRLRAAHDGRPDGPDRPHVRARALARDWVHLCRSARAAGVAQQRAARPSGRRARIDRRRALDAQLARRDRIRRRDRARRRRGVVAGELLARAACRAGVRDDARTDRRDRAASGSLREGRIAPAVLSRPDRTSVGRFPAYVPPRSSTTCRSRARRGQRG